MIPMAVNFNSSGGILAAAVYDATSATVQSYVIGGSPPGPTYTITHLGYYVDKMIPFIPLYIYLS
jgi:hypothetical protein